MALREHFHPPLSARRHWHAFHNAWATYIASDLNRRLPEGYFAEPNVQFGIEIDVATFEESSQVSSDDRSQEGVVDSLPAGSGIGWTPPPPMQTIPFQPATDIVEVSIFSDEAGPTLAGAIELVSPANKDRQAHCDAFVSRCETYLQGGIGLVVVDVVTVRKANLHDQLLLRLAAPEISRMNTELYAVSYRPVERDGQPSLDVWQETLAVGRSLPTMPLWLRGTLCLPVELDATYARTCQEQRIPVNGT
ncbi:DUF4058 family protein [Candidatus Poribacteria bacterium]|nr:DUF4058 family protein [Candidatus Poribacteria bacterium]